MDLSTFWGLVEGSRAVTSDPDDRLEWLTDRLAELPVGEIADFQVLLDGLRSRVDTWEHWQAAHLICRGFCSDDGFFYFQAWLVGLGRETFERVAASPDALAEVPQVRWLFEHANEAWPDDDWPEWECLDYVAADAYERVTGRDGLTDLLAARGYETPRNPDPEGESWDFADPSEITRRVPRLGELFGKVA